MLSLTQVPPLPRPARPRPRPVHACVLRKPSCGAASTMTLEEAGAETWCRKAVPCTLLPGEPQSSLLHLPVRVGGLTLALLEDRALLPPHGLPGCPLSGCGVSWIMAAGLSSWSPSFLGPKVADTYGGGAYRGEAETEEANLDRGQA